MHKAPLGIDEGSFKDLEQIPMRDAQGTDHVCYLPAKAVPTDDKGKSEAGEDVRLIHLSTYDQ